jgi:hypothetical protein
MTLPRFRLLCRRIEIFGWGSWMLLELSASIRQPKFGDLGLDQECTVS